MKTHQYSFALLAVSFLCGCAVTKNVCPNCSCTNYSLHSVRDAGGPYKSGGISQHGTTSAKLGEAYSFWAATSVGDGHTAGALWFRKITVDETGRVVSIGPAEKSVVFQLLTKDELPDGWNGNL